MTSHDVVAQLEAGPLPLAKLVGDRPKIAKLLVELLRSGAVITIGTRSRYMYALRAVA